MQKIVREKFANFPNLCTLCFYFFVKSCHQWKNDFISQFWWKLFSLNLHLVKTSISRNFCRVGKNPKFSHCALASTILFFKNTHSIMTWISHCLYKHKFKRGLKIYALLVKKKVYETADIVAHRENCKYPTVHSHEPLPRCRLESITFREMIKKILWVNFR